MIQYETTANNSFNVLLMRHNESVKKLYKLEHESIYIIMISINTNLNVINIRLRKDSRQENEYLPLHL